MSDNKLLNKAKNNNKSNKRKNFFLALSAATVVGISSWFGITKSMDDYYKEASNPNHKIEYSISRYSNSEIPLYSDFQSLKKLIDRKNLNTNDFNKITTNIILEMKKIQIQYNKRLIEKNDNKANDNKAIFEGIPNYFNSYVDKLNEIYKEKEINIRLNYMNNFKIHQVPKY